MYLHDPFTLSSDSFFISLSYDVITFTNNQYIEYFINGIQKTIYIIVSKAKCFKHLATSVMVLLSVESL